MKEFKGYQTHNESKEVILKQLYSYLTIAKKHFGTGIEDEILERNNAVALSELSTATLIEEYKKLKAFVFLKESFFLEEQQ